MVLSDTWLFRAATGTWTKVRYASGTPEPVARSGSALTYVGPRGQVVLFGRRGNSGLLCDLWGWDGTTWRPIAQNNAGPSLAFMGMTYDSVQSRTWTYDFATALWTNLGQTIGLEGRSGTPMTYLPTYGTRLFFGGSSTTTVAGDVWEGRQALALDRLMGFWLRGDDGGQALL